jgi:hypothetical protein
MSLTGINAIDQYETEEEIPESFHGAALIQCVGTNELWLSNGVTTERVGSNMDNSSSSNYSFAGNMIAGAGKYNLYMAGTANNYLAGSLGIGTTSLTGFNLRIGKDLTGSVDSVSVLNFFQINSDVTSTATGFQTQLSTQAASFTTGGVYHFLANALTIRASSTVTNQYGHYTGSLTGATNNYGFYGAIPAGTGRYNLYMNGTAANYLAGDLQLAKTVTAGGTTGAQTINKTTGTVNFAAAATSLVVTNSLVTTSSIIIATVGTNDTTMKSVQVVAGAGSFTIYANAAAAAETRVNFLITN